MENYHCLISPNEVLTFDRQQGVVFFGGFPELLRLARAMFISPYHNIQFYHQPPTPKSKPFLVNLTLNDPEQLVQASAYFDAMAFGLTVRELHIITLLSAGLSDHAIGDILFISHRTVGKHIQHIFEKTGVDSRTALSALAHLHSLYCLPSHYSILSHAKPISIPLLHLHTLANTPRPTKPTPIRTPTPLRIGIPFAVGERGAIDSISQQNGARLAMKHINTRGKLGRTLDVIFCPFEVGNPDSIIKAYRLLIDQEVDGISASYACFYPDVFELVASYGVPYLHTATSHQAVQHAHTHGMDNIFQLCASDVNYGLGIIRLIRTYTPLWRHKCLIVIKPTWQTVDIGDYLESHLANVGWRLELIEINDDNWQNCIQSLHKIAGDIVVLASFFAEDMMSFYDEFIKNPTSMLIYGIYAPSALIKNHCEGVVWATTNGLVPNDQNAFVRAYQEHYHATPNHAQASLAYDSVQILARAWQHEPYAKQFNKVKSALKNTVNHGINGAYYLGGLWQSGLSYPDDTTDLTISQAHLVFQIQKGKQTLIDPSPFAQNVLQVPFWWHGT